MHLLVDNLSDSTKCTVKQLGLYPHFTFNNYFFATIAIYEIMWGKYCKAGQATNVNVIQRMRFSYWIKKGYRHALVSV